MRTEGRTLNTIAEGVGVSIDTVRRALAHGPQLESDEEFVGEGAPERRHHPADCLVDRHANWSTSMPAGRPAVGAELSLPLGGALIILPALAATGLLDATVHLYGIGRNTFGRLRTLVLSTVFTFLLSERGVEDSVGVDPTDIGRLVGRDRALEVTTVNRRLLELAALRRADSLIDALARWHLESHREVDGIFYLDGQVLAYRGSAEVESDDLVRVRLSIGADIEARLLDRVGDGVLLWTAPAEGSVDELRAVLTKVRDRAGPAARPTICFERGGWPPKLFAELAALGFDIVAYGKGGPRVDPVRSFHWQSFADDRGNTHRYSLADREAHFPYDTGRRHFTCREIVCLERRTDQQIQILTTRVDPEAATIAHAMFDRWPQERFMETMRTLHDVDVLDRAGGTTSAVPDPGSDAACLARERERIHDALRMAAYNAESALIRVLPYHAASGDTARRLVTEAFRTTAAVQIIGDEIHVRLERASTVQGTRALGALCAELTTTRTVYPGTKLRLVFAMERGEADMG